MLTFKNYRTLSIGLPLAVTVLALAIPAAVAQRNDDWNWDGSYQRLTRINSGTFVTVRTTESINADQRDGRVFPGEVVEDVWDDYGRLAVPAIPRGSRVDLVVRN